MVDPTGEQSADFSRYLLALARQSMPTVWLTSINITGPQQAIDLAGSTFRPGDVPDFLQKLQREPVFMGKTFAKLALLPAEKIPGQIDFKLQALLEMPDSQVMPQGMPKVKAAEGGDQAQGNNKNAQ